MIRSREVGLFNAYSFALAGILTFCFWSCVFALQLFGVRDLSENYEPYLAYNLISIGGLLLQLYQTAPGRVNILALDSLQNLRISASQAVHVAGALTVMLVLTKDTVISRLFLVIYLLVLFAFLLLSNAMIPGALSRLFFSGNNQVPALLVGRLSRVARMRHWLRRMDSYGVCVVGMLTEEKNTRTKTVQRVPIVGTAQDLAAVLAKIRIDTVILLDVPREQSVLDSLIEATDRAGVRMIVINNLAETFKHSLQYYRQFGVDFIVLRQEPLQDPLNRILKRAFDIAVSLPAVVFLLPPLALVVWLTHRRESPGPLFFTKPAPASRIDAFKS